MSPPFAEFAQFAKTFQLEPAAGQERRNRRGADVISQATSLRALRLGRKAVVNANASGDHE